MKIGRLALIGYAIFLVGYSWWKYSVAAPAEFSAAYAQSVAVLVLMTGVVPFLLTFGAIKAAGVRGVAGGALGLIFGAIFCVGAYAAFWALFIAPSAADVAVTEVALRGVGWGLLQGGLASIAANH